jgi:tripartite-type tricarboxylate transporter receptor subunit TctC
MINRRAAAIFFAVFAALGSAQAQNYPDRPIKIIAPFPPGSATDIWARAIGQQLQLRLNQSVIVENKAGAAGQIGTDFAAKAAPDGYTLLIGTPVNAIHVRLFANKLPYDFQRDFSPVIHLAAYPLVLVTGAQTSARSFEDLVAEGKGGRLSYGSSGPGSSAHLAGELMEIQVKHKMTHVPYKGTPAAYNDLLGGNLTMLFDNVTVAQPQVKAGKVKALLVASPKRSKALPDVPTSAEKGYPELLASSFVTVFTRTGTPAPVIAKLNAEINAILADPAFREKFEAQGAEIGGGTPQDLIRFFDAEVKRWSHVIDVAQVKPD